MKMQLFRKTWLPVAGAVVLTLGLGLPASSLAGGYVFTPIAFLGDPAPGGGNVIDDFEPGAINNRGDVIYGTDLGTSTDPDTFFGEGVFLQRAGQISELARATGSAPGGGVFDFALLGQTVVNGLGDAAFAFTLSPFSFPFGVNSGVYRYSHITRTVTPVVIPYVTPAPGGGTFSGVFFGTSLNNRGDVVFPGIVETDDGIHNVPDTGEPYIGLGVGVFRADARGRISKVVRPGDPAPGGGTFDYADEGWVNDGGDVSFIGHIAGEESVIAGNPPQAEFISTLSGLYVKRWSTGEIRTIVHAGDPAPGGGNFRQAFGPVMNRRGDIAFGGDLTPPPGAIESIGVFVYSGGRITAVARPGDAMPGGGTLVNASSLAAAQIHINNAGEVVFNALLDTDDNADGTLDTGLFLWSHGSLRLVARTGTVIPGVGTVAQLVTAVIEIPPPPILVPNSGAINNDRGQVLFGATLSDGRGVLLVATPTE